MPLVSYAQHAEDIVLSLLFPESTGFYVDIGANDPAFCSVTKLFYDLGWDGINVEPVPALHEKLQATRPRDRNLNLGMSNEPGTLTFYESPCITGWSTFNPELADVYRRRGLTLVERPIPVTTLASLFEQYVDRPVNFLKIDVEGFEREVLEGMDWSRCRPRVLVIENAFSERWLHLVPESDYVEFHNDGINRFYVRHDEPGLLAAWHENKERRHDYVCISEPRKYERKLAALASRDDLGLVERGWRRAIDGTMRLSARLSRFGRRAG